MECLVKKINRQVKIFIFNKFWLFLRQFTFVIGAKIHKPSNNCVLERIWMFQLVKSFLQQDCFSFVEVYFWFWKSLIFMLSSFHEKSILFFFLNELFSVENFTMSFILLSILQQDVWYIPVLASHESRRNSCTKVPSRNKSVWSHK